ncbi:hypothetical protein ACWGA9_06150 [Streptomyces sp. NPDC054950]
MAVTAGAEYITRIPVGLATAQAGLNATATIEWWTAPSGGTLVSSTVSPAFPVTNSVGWFALGYAVATATAPATATHALIKLSVSGMAAAAQVFVDEVYFGVAQNRANNAYSFNTSSIEMDTTGWKIDTGTLARGNYSLFGGAGYYALTFTSPAAGTHDIRTNSFIGVIAGTTYVSYAAVLAPALATTWYFELRWYDAAFNPVGTTVQRTYSIAANTIERLSLVGTAPAGALYTKAFVRPVATAASQLFVIDDASLSVAPNIAGNLLTYDEYSTEYTLPGWTVTNGTTSQAYITSSLTDGFYSLKVVPTAPGVITGQLNRLVPVTPGSTYMVKVTSLRHSTDLVQAIHSAMRVRVDWYDSAGDMVQADNPDQFYAYDVVGEFLTQLTSETRTCPSGAAFARIGWEVDSSSPLIDAWYFDNIHLVPAVSEYVLFSDSETGSVSLTLQKTYPTANNITIQRVDADGNKYSLRGYGSTYDNAPYTPGVVQVEDYEAPLGSKVWYSVSWFNGTTRVSRLFTQTIDAPILADPDYVWFKSPGIPALNTRVMMEAPLKWSRSARSTRFDIVGRKNPLSQYDVRAGRESSLSVLIWDPSAHALFNSLLDTGAPALVQAMPGYGIEGNLYVSIGDVDSDPLDPDAREPGWRWTLSVLEVDRPDGGLQGSAALTWADINADYATWDDLFDAHPSWADVLLKG